MTERDGDRIAILDDALWKRFEQSKDIAEFSRVWLALQIRQIGGVKAGVVVLDRGDGMAPVATWPQGSPPDQRLVDVVDTTVAEGVPSTSGNIAIAQPLIVGELVGAVGLLFEATMRDIAKCQSQLRWGTGWLTDAVRSAIRSNEAVERARMGAVLDVVGAVLDAETVSGAALAAVNLLARVTGSAQVALGLHRGRQLRVLALSDVADFRLNTARTRALERAMVEAADQEGSVLHPARPGQPFVVDLAHKAMAHEFPVGEILTVPLFASDSIAGALHLQKAPDEGFSDDDLMVAEGAAATLGGLLVEKRQAERTALSVFMQATGAHLGRLFGPRFIGRKIAVLLVVALVAFFWFATGQFRVTAEAEVQGRIIRTVTAPFDGNIFEQFARAGDQVRAGSVLARLDERDLRIELLRATTDFRRFDGEYDRALADRNAPEARIAAANRDEAVARAELIEAQLERATLVAPFDAVVISGDLSQSLGAPVRRGEPLFEIAPLESYRVQLEVEETDLDEIAIGQPGRLVLASLPGERFVIEITQIVPVLEARDGRNVALIEAQVLGGGEQIRPGMGGVAKVDIEERLLIQIWAQPIIDWARLLSWRWSH